MTSTVDNLISTLSDDMAVVKAAASPGRMFVGWITVSLLYMAVLLCFGRFRPDVMAKFHDQEFLTEVSLLVLLIISCGLSAMALSFPDLYQKRALALAPVPPFLVFIGLLGWSYSNDTMPLPAHGMECLLCIAMYSFVPALILMTVLRKQASTRPAAAGAVSLLAAASIGCLALRLSEETDSIRHLVTWHYLPMVGFALLGVLLGRRMLKW